MLADRSTMLVISTLTAFAVEVDLIGPAGNGVASDNPDTFPIEEVFGVLPVEFAAPRNPLKDTRGNRADLLEVAFRYRGDVVRDVR
jgi:hypothetical protein